MREPTNAQDILLTAADAIQSRADQRDHPSGERSVSRAVAMFNDLTGHKLSERDGWIIMALLKLSRAQGGRYHLDDYVDAAAYIALAGEAAQQEQETAHSTMRLFNGDDRRRFFNEDDLRSFEVAAGGNPR